MGEAQGTGGARLLPAVSDDRDSMTAGRLDPRPWPGQAGDGEGSAAEGVGVATAGAAIAEEPGAAVAETPGLLWLPLPLLPLKKAGMLLRGACGALARTKEYRCCGDTRTG